MLVEEQISARQLRARTAIQSILAKPPGQGYGDYEVKAASGRKYRVAMRGPSLFENYCTCPDFAVNTLGTCKHIEGLLIHLRERFGRSFRRQAYRRSRASLALHYGETLQVRLRLPVDCSPALREISADYFDSDGFLRAEHLRQFDRASRSSAPRMKPSWCTATCWISSIARMNWLSVWMKNAALSQAWSTGRILWKAC
jgi:hypothetical protein